MAPRPVWKACLSVWTWLPSRRNAWPSSKKKNINLCLDVRGLVEKNWPFLWRIWSNLEIWKQKRKRQFDFCFIESLQMTVCCSTFRVALALNWSVLFPSLCWISRVWEIFFTFRSNFTIRRPERVSKERVSKTSYEKLVTISNLREIKAKREI